MPNVNFGVQWEVAIQSLTAKQPVVTPALGPDNVNFSPQGSGCSALFDSGNYEISVPQPTLTAVFQLLGLGTDPTLAVTTTSRALQLICAHHLRGADNGRFYA